MAMTLRLTDEETEALRQKASEEGRSMQDVARTAINRYTRDEDAEFRGMVATVVARDRELLDRLAR
jgi:predicted DNA binding CopG/RHH family protein